MFFGANSEVKEVISDNIRALGSCKEDILPIEVNIEKGTKQIIIAVPVGYKVKKIEDNTIVIRIIVGLRVVLVIIFLVSANVNTEKYFRNSTDSDIVEIVCRI